ncbi:hypothetical protein [Micromonospora sp. DPT]
MEVHAASPTTAGRLSVRLATPDTGSGISRESTSNAAGWAAS